MLKSFHIRAVQLQKAAREMWKAWSQTGFPKGLTLSFKTQARTLHSVQLSSPNNQRRHVAMGIGSFSKETMCQALGWTSGI